MTRNFNDDFDDLDGLLGDDDSADDLSSAFGDDFDDEDFQQTFKDDVSSFDEVLIEDDEGRSSRTFLVAFFLLMATVVVILIAIVLVALGNDDDTDAQSTSIALTNQAIQVALQSTGTAESIAVQNALAQTEAAEEANRQTAVAAATQTQNAILTAVHQTETAIAQEATFTQAALDTAIAQTHQAETLAAITPTPAPFEIPGQIERVDDSSASLSFVIEVYVDNGDGQFRPPPTPTPMPSPSATPSSTASPTFSQPVVSTPTATVGSIDENATEEPSDDGEITEEDLAGTTIALTVTAQAQSFDATATARASTANQPPFTTPQVTSVAEVPPIDNVEIDIPLTLTSDDGQISVNVPLGWISDDRIATEGVFYFGESPAAIDTRATIALDAPPQIEGLGGSLFVQALADFGESQATPELIDELLISGLEITADTGGEILEEAQPFTTLEDGIIGSYAVTRNGNQQAFVAVLGFTDSLSFVTVSATVDTFEANRDLLFAVLGSIRVASQSTTGPSAPPFDVPPSEDTSDTPPFDPDATDEVSDNSIGAAIQEHEGRVMFLRVGRDSQSGVFQDGLTPTPPGNNDSLLTQIVVQSDGSFTLPLPGEPGGTYYLVASLPPGTYRLNIENQSIEFTVPETGTFERTIPLTDRNLVLVITPRTLPTPTPPSVVGEGGPLSPFLQTATANARGAEGGTVVTAIPETGLFADGLDDATPGGLTFLALMGAGLIGIVFIVRRLRSTM